MKILKEEQIYKLNCSDRNNRIYNVLNHIKYLLTSGYNLEMRICSNWFFIEKYSCSIDNIEVISNGEDFTTYKIHCIDEKNELLKILYYLSGVANIEDTFEVRIYPLEKFEKSFKIYPEDFVWDIQEG